MSGATANSTRANFVIQETKFNRYISHNIYGYKKYLSEGGAQLYSEQEIHDLIKAGVADRLPPRATKHYMELAAKSDAITNLIKARPEETADLSGERDPSNQLKYSPVPGLLHKYELALIYVARACSSWCRYCYRSDFLTSKTEKDIADVKDVSAYIKSHNEKYKAAEAANPGQDKIFPLKEVLLSGGDPMVLSNNNMFEWWHGLAEAGIKTIRMGTKELAFFPQRFDDNFFAMVDMFHEMHPNVNIAFMVHFTHPDEILWKDPVTRQYVKDENGDYRRIEITEKAIQRLRGRHYVTLENQTPIIDSVNDDSNVLRLLQVQLKRLGINNHYYFQCREIEGHKAFAVPVEKAWKIHNDSQRGLSGIEKSRFAMSTEAGKLEVVAVIDKPNFKELGVEIPAEVQAFLNVIIGDGLVVMRQHRTPYAEKQGDIVIARRNPNALWISGYEDRIIYDGRKGAGNQYAPLAELLKKIFSTFGKASQPVKDEVIAGVMEEFGLAGNNKKQGKKENRAAA